jgi:hypothetical protein
VVTLARAVGFFVLRDPATYARWRLNSNISRLSVQTRIVLASSLGFALAGTVLITGSLTVVGKWVIAITMPVGRVGP